MRFANPVDGPRIVPYGQPRLPTDKLPNGHLGFRVTQRFSDVNPDFKEFGQHGAMDVGNYVGGDHVKAMAAGTVANVYEDDAGALIVLLQHPGNLTTLYAHLSAQWVRRGQKVTEGQLIGAVGNTGLGAVYHLHVEVRHNGVKVDPWPLLAQNQLPDTALESGDPMLKAKHEGWRTGTAGTTVYQSPDGLVLFKIPAGVEVSTTGETLDGAWRQLAVSRSPGDRTYAYAKRAELTPLVSGGDPLFDNAVWNLLLSRKPTAGADCTAQDNKIAAARTAVGGTVQAALAAQRALA